MVKPVKKANIPPAQVSRRNKRKEVKIAEKAISESKTKTDKKTPVVDKALHAPAPVQAVSLKPKNDCKDARVVLLIGGYFENSFFHFKDSITKANKINTSQKYQIVKINSLTELNDDLISELNKSQGLAVFIDDVNFQRSGDYLKELKKYLAKIQTPPINIFYQDFSSDRSAHNSPELKHLNESIPNTKLITIFDPVEFMGEKSPYLRLLGEFLDLPETAATRPSEAEKKRHIKTL